jgi:hypothetical protein
MLTDLVKLRSVSNGVQRIKYGVIQHSAALRDLLDWEFLYLAGRMHKPVATLTCCPRITEAQAQNQKAAVAAALLLLPQHFTWERLLHTICGLSYQGKHSFVICVSPQLIVATTTDNCQSSECW